MPKKKATKKPQDLWHHLPIEEVLKTTKGKLEGFSQTEASARLQEHGSNILPVGKQKKLWQVFLCQFLSPLIYLLIAAGIASLVLEEHLDAIFIFGIVLLNAVIGTIQEWRAESSIRALDSYISHKVVVLRGGSEVTIDASDLVIGDIVILEAGQKVGADMRLLEANEVRVDESLLTGESVPILKDVNAKVDKPTPLAERLNMLYAGTVIENGSGKAVVVATGARTSIGNIADALTGKGFARPPLVERMDTFAKRLTYLAISVMVVLSGWLMWQGEPFASVFMLAVALAVAAVPEGLPISVTVAMAVGVLRMAKKHVIVRQLPAVEGLGACSMVFSDKTGTLTINSLTAQVVWLPEGGHVLLKGVSFDASKRKQMWRLALAGLLCNDATIQNGKPVGDSVDVAFMRFAKRMEINRARILRFMPLKSVLPFDANYRYAASFHKLGKKTVVAVKGGPEAVAALCGDPNAKWLKEVDRLAEGGYKVLALAGGTVKKDNRKSLDKLTFLGLVAMIDPVRPEVTDAIAECRVAGVDVRMVTGDHPATALAISQQIGIAKDADQVVSGVDLAAFKPNSKEFQDLVIKSKVFARVEPLQKQQIVSAAMGSGAFVAVTGDGVNDAPALKMANIGVAMGKSGTDIARGASDLVLTDDNFASIVGGIEEGRIVYSNVRKVVNLLVTAGFAEVMIFVFSLLMGLPLPLTAVQLLWLNVVTNGIQDKAMALEKAEPGIMRRNPHPANEGIFNRPMIAQILFNGSLMAIGCTAVFWYGLNVMELTEADARNITLLTMVLFENAYTFVARSETRSTFTIPPWRNAWLWVAVLTAQGVHLLAMYVPTLQELLGTAPVTFTIWQQLLYLALGLLLAGEMFKFVIKRL